MHGIQETAFHTSHITVVWECFLVMDSRAENKKTNTHIKNASILRT